MTVSVTAFALHLGPDTTPLLPEQASALLGRLARGGLDPTALAPPASAGLQFRVPYQTGWEELNLGALGAAARARPGVVVELPPSRPGQPVVTAVQGPPGFLQHRAGWRLDPPPSSPISAVLLDRDGTIIEDRHYLADPAGVALLGGAAEGLRLFVASGVRLVILTNQSGVGLDRIRPGELAAVHNRMRTLLMAEAVQLDGIFVCPHRPDAGCACRKPADGLARQAAADLGLDLRTVVVVGDKASDLGLGRGLGVPAFLVATGEGAQTLASGGPPADYLVEDLTEMARICAHPAGVAIPRRLADEGAASDA